MRQYATRLSDVAKVLGSSSRNDDPSIDVIIALANAYEASLRLGQVADLELAGRTLVIQSIERAYREALHIRATRLPTGIIDTSQISRLGRLHVKSKVSD
jgi:hypothetical protein